MVICWVLLAVLNATTAWQLAETRRRAREYLQNA